MSDTVLELKNVSKTYGKRKIIDNISLQVKQGEICGFLGPNGSGKTTTIKMILRLIEKDSGEIKVNGYNTKKQFEKAMECIGAIVENPDVYGYMSGIDNLKLHARIRNIDDKRIDEVLKLVDLKDRAKDKVSKYSLGMKQRLGLAITLLHKPKVLILDEPTNGLDPAGIKKLRDILKDLAHEKGVGVFVSSHILSEMQLMCDKVVVIDKGKIVKVEEISEKEERNIEKIELRVNQIEQAANIIRHKFEIESIINENNLELKIHTEKVPQLVKELVINGVEIKAIIPKVDSLEDIFFDATEGGDNND